MTARLKLVGSVKYYSAIHYCAGIVRRFGERLGFVFALGVGLMMVTIGRYVILRRWNYAR